MHEHHERAIARLVDELGDDPRFLAVLLAGSLARGTARPDSDVDLILIASEQENARRLARGDLVYMNTEVCDWPGGYAEGKVVPLSYLEEVAERGSEPARAAFEGARVLCARIDGIEALLARATGYPEAERAAKLRSFYTQVLIHYWYVCEAERLDDRYLLLRAVSDLALFAGRLILAHNRVLFPYHKWFLHALRRAPDKPASLLADLEALLAEPSRERANALLASVLNFRDWEKPPHGLGVQFMHDSEWHWRRGEAPVTDR